MLVLHDLIDKMILRSADGNNCLDIITMHQILSLSAIQVLILTVN